MITKLEIGNPVYCAIHGHKLGVIIALHADGSIRIADNVVTAANAKDINVHAITLNPPSVTKPAASEIFILPPDKPEHYGDWHDKPVRYKVCGPGNELQKFCNKKDARLYKSIRLDSMDANTASRKFAATA